MQIDQGYDPKLKRFNLAKLAAEVVFDKYADFSFRIGICGENGSGKSTNARFVCVNIAMEESIKQFREPDRWEEFFPYEENTAIILEDEMQKVAKKEAHRQVKFYDEIQEEIASSLMFYSAGNKAFNKEFRIKRPWQNPIVATLPELFMQDKGSRHLYNALVEQIPGMSAHKYGIGFCKVKFVSLQSLEESNRMHKYFPVVHGTIYPIAIYGLSPKKFERWYKKKREDNQKISEERAYEEAQKEKQYKDAIRDKVIQGGTGKAVKIKEMLQEDPNLSGAKIARKLSEQGVKVSSAYVNNIRNELLSNDEQ
jgi:hypothetical protein